MLRRAAVLGGLGAGVLLGKSILCSGSPAMAAADTSVAALKRRVPTVFSPAGAAVPLDEALPPGRVTVLHLLRRFK